MSPQRQPVRRAAMQEGKIQVTGFAWFKEDDYESFKPILPERRWHRTYAEWEAAAEQHFKRLNDQGIRTVKAEIRSADFVAWCRRTGRNIDNKALVALANEAACRVIEGSH
ncbi:hypothetical protein XFUD_10910 [Xylella fastidiosa]|uniref:Uncharacterized protein n=1 Tax=Xylella fastidiosa (strain 9a5c) TaxID=160492 RepID=Q9PAK8_XYLFA|nr:hypothetical protein XF_2507 [Xylella fastidiosa 9a5c]ALQ95555.1 hypothetical protein XFUD_10910 [Xylella fastidiosa]OCA57266.1 hypothetical protein AA93_10720 [Xylella fastidiosa subsp. pauca 11399]ALR01479.1 hypothetical protein OY18_03685 [Xylella fastidiosa]ALR09610.2 hypothetical protein XFFB_10915 [Xylella fastidiosa]